MYYFEPSVARNRNKRIRPYKDNLKSVFETIDFLTLRTLKERIEGLEKQAILEALQICLQNKRQAAKLLGFSRRDLLDKMKRYEIKIV